ncbi:MAG: hypothetical protein RI552_07040 [Spiribacter sp.]|nr:hypothetical protein [Spiribacter sp.]MDR9454373.1 hypothetical protein [Spiribacter sp.]
MQPMPDAAVVIDSVDPAMTCDLMASGLPVVELTQCGGRPVTARYHQQHRWRPTRLVALPDQTADRREGLRHHIVNA